MKYKVIGWTYYEDYNIPESSKTIGFSERNAIIDEIKKHKYLFSGYDHQESFDNCVPILNDGKKRIFSQRGWGGVMAEAYGYMNDYDYVNFTFYNSISSKAKSYSCDEFNYDEFVPEIIENEEYSVNVCEKIFSTAKNNNKFYLDDLDELRYIDINDVITLNYNGDKFTCLVTSINRNKKEIDRVDVSYINTEYKIIVQHKPYKGKLLNRKPLKITNKEANNLFVSCENNYDFHILYELFNDYSIDVVTKKSKSKSTKETIKKFILEYSDYAYDERVMSNLLDYINEYELYEKVVSNNISNSNGVLINFVMKYLNKNEDINKYVIKVAKMSDSSFYNLEILLKAIDLCPNIKSYKKLAYKNSMFYEDLGFLAAMSGNLINILSKVDKLIIDLSDVNNRGHFTILRIVEFLSYPNDKITEDNYPYTIPLYYKNKYNYNCLKIGIDNYKKYLNENYDIENRLMELLIIGIKKKCSDIGNLDDSYFTSAEYIYALDLLTNFKYNLKEYTINEYKNDYPELVNELNKMYNK